MSEAHAQRLAALMESAESHFVPASEQFLVEIPAFGFELWALAVSEAGARITLAGIVAAWLRKEAR